MALTITLDPRGPHTPDYTRQVGAAFAESVRVLNYATAGSGLEFPGDLYDALGLLRAGAGGLDQLLHQLSAFLDLQLKDGRLRRDDGGDPALAIAAFAAAMIAAWTAAIRLYTELEHAQEAIASVAARLPGPEGKR